MNILWTIAAAALLATGQAGAHEGHDDGPKAAPVASGAPRFETHSDLFELVGSVVHGELVLYLDGYADNAPVKGAVIEVDAGAVKGTAKAAADGSYRLAFANGGKPASLTFVVNAGGQSDLLAADLPAPAAPAAAHQAAASAGRWKTVAGGGAGALVLAAGSLWMMRRRRGQGA